MNDTNEVEQVKKKIIDCFTQAGWEITETREGIYVRRGRKYDEDIIHIKKLIKHILGIP